MPTWPTEAVRVFLLEAHIADLHLGGDALSIPGSLGAPEEHNAGRGLRRSGLRLLRYLCSLEVTTLEGRIVMLLLHVDHPPCTLDELPLRLFEAYGVASVMEGERCRVSSRVRVQWHGPRLGILATAA